jgi:hypothetical protein
MYICARREAGGCGLWAVGCSCRAASCELRAARRVHLVLAPALMRAVCVQNGALFLVFVFIC